MKLIDRLLYVTPYWSFSFQLKLHALHTSSFARSMRIMAAARLPLLRIDNLPIICYYLGHKDLGSVGLHKSGSFFMAQKTYFITSTLPVFVISTSRRRPLVRAA